jgi:hypothetical protein
MDFEPNPVLSAPVSSATSPERRGVRVNRIGDRLEMVSTKRHWGMVSFLLAWLALWSVACVALLGMVLFQFSLFALVFAVPFWVAWLAVAFVVGNLLAMREVLVLDEAGLAYRRTVLGILMEKRNVPLREITVFSSPLRKLQHSDDADQSPPHFYHALAAETIGAPVELRTPFDEAEAAWLVQQFSDACDTLRRHSGPIDRRREPAAGTADPSELPATLELRPPSEGKVLPPSDTRWQLHRDPEATVFLLPGKISWTALAGLLFVTLFWNSGVGVFVAALAGWTPVGANAKRGDGDGWWLLFLLLVPFVAAGLLMALCVVAMLLEPLRRTRWILQRDSLVHRNTLAGLGRSRAFDMKQLARLELRRATCPADESPGGSVLAAAMQKKQQPSEHRTSSAPQPLPLATVPATRPPPYSLSFMHADGQEVCKIDRLTLGEACWIADIVLYERGRWFC